MSVEPDIRQRILAAAKHLFAHQGYGSTSVRELVEAAGVTKPTLYYYFDGKEGLFREVIAEKLSESETRMAEAASADEPVLERLRAITRASLQAASTDPDGFRLLLTCSLPNHADHPEVDVLSRHLRNLEPLELLVAEGIRRGEFRSDLDPHTAVLMLVGAVNMHLIAILKGPAVELDIVDVLIDTWLRGVTS